MVDTRAPMHAVGGVGSAETYGLSGSGEARHHKARLGAHPHAFQPDSEPAEAAAPQHQAAGAASFAGQTQQPDCQCVRDGRCTCQGQCRCSHCTGSHTAEQLAGQQDAEAGQPSHAARPAVTGI